MHGVRYKQIECFEKFKFQKDAAIEVCHVF